jgi:hypothetical protein
MQKNYRQNFKGVLFFGLFFLIVCFSPTNLPAQEVVDKTVATISDGVRTELITYSDLLWQLALQPNVPINPPSSEDLNRVLQTLIDQRLIALEAQRLPRTSPSDKEVNDEIERVLALFPSPGEFERRLRSVGFDSVKNDNFKKMMEQRVAIEKYLDFRFRSFVVITPEDEARYYRDVYTPDFRKKHPGLLLPPLDEKRAEINQILTERKIQEDIEKFLDDAKRTAEIVVLFEV